VTMSLEDVRQTGLASIGEAASKQFVPRLTLSRFWFGLSVVVLSGLAIGALRIDTTGNLAKYVALIEIVVAVPLLLLRLIDIGMSRWLTLAVFVPVLNIYVLWCCLAKPTGFAIDGRSDSAMKIMTAACIVFPPFLILFGFLWLGLSRDPHEVPSPLINKPAPAFQLAQLQEPDKKFSAEEMRGKVWLLNVWASWCVSCREEHPMLLELARKKTLPIYGLNWKDQREDAISWLSQLGNPYVLSVSDLEGSVAIDYGVYGAPETYLIDKNGVIRFKVIGPLDRDTLEKKVLPLAAELNGKSDDR
jgi:cytochrome c biogenesis protein CcmG, thiol:disulfide interchange protein DsbE